jgi:HD-GYP domain-containing protein (c-di-GMP phosphodiesterase class II)
MNTWLVSDLKPGMRFSKAVYVDGNNMLAPEGLPIKDKDIQRLIKWGISAVQSEGNILPDQPLPGNKKEPLARIAFIATDKEVTDEYHFIAEAVRELFKRIADHEMVAEHEINDVVDRLLHLLSERRNDVIQYILFGLQGESDWVENAINAAVISTIVGMNANLPRHKLSFLAAGALLHDIGMLRVPKEILDKRESLSQAELQQIKTHPLHSYRIIVKEIKLPEEIGMTALQHQERWDGQGYPKGLKGKDITMSARIVAIADAFEAMVSNRPYRDSMIGYTAMRTIRRFDPEVLKIFIRSFGIYPIGSIILLSDASIGRVIQNHPDAPLRPRIRVMIDSLGVAHLNDAGEILDLFDDRSVFIARAVNPKELAVRAQQE